MAGEVGGARRLDPAARRRIILLIVLLAAASVFGVVQLIVGMELSGTFDIAWVYGVVAVDVVLLVLVVYYTRGKELGVSDFLQRLASRTKETGMLGEWLLAVFDNGLVMQGQRAGAVVSFYLCYGSDLTRYAPTMSEIKAYMQRFGVMRRVQAISSRKGDPAARAMLDQLRRQLGTRWMVLQLSRRRPDKRPGVKAPTWLVGITCYWAKWNRNPGPLLNGLDSIEGLLDLAQRQTFAATMAAG